MKRLRNLLLSNFGYLINTLEKKKKNCENCGNLKGFFQMSNIGRLFSF